MWIQAPPIRGSDRRHHRTRRGHTRPPLAGLALVVALAGTSGCGADNTPGTTAVSSAPPTVTTPPDPAPRPTEPTAPMSVTPKPSQTAKAPATAKTPNAAPNAAPWVPRGPTTKPAAKLGPMSLSAPSIDVSGSLRRTSAVNGVVTPPAGVLVWVTGYGRVRPGEVGTAVIAGHVVNGKRADVFYNLQDIKRGDKVTVRDREGRPVVYTVTATRVATKRAVSLDAVVWGRNSSVRRIALITCDDDDGFRPDGHRVANFVAIAEAR